MEITKDNIKQFYVYPYEDLRELLYTLSKEEKELILSDYKIKDKLINCENRHDFTWLAQLEDDDIILNLLKDEGLELLKNSDFFIDKMNAILTSDCKYVDELFEKDEFCKMISDNLFELKDYFYVISNKSSNILYNYLLKNNEDDETAISFLSRINRESIKYIVENNDFDSKYYLILTLKLANKDKKYAEKYLKDNIEKFNYCEFDLNIMKNLILSNISIPYKIIESKKFTEEINKINDIKEFRYLMNYLEKNNDVSKLEEKREKKYENELNSFVKEEKMLKKYFDLYNEIVSEIPLHKNDKSEILHSIFEKYFSNKNYIVFNDWYYLFEKVRNSYDENDFSKLKNLFIEESNYETSNIILDYLFKDIYYNVLIDMRELVSFQEKVGITIGEDSYNYYKKLLKIDELSYEEKMELFNKLKQDNYLEIFYDDIRNSKDLSYKMIKDEILNKAKLEKYKNNEASKEYGVDIYQIEGDSFYTLIKSSGIVKYKPLTEFITGFGDGLSFSIDGSDKLCCFEKTNETYTFLYDDFNIEQVVHTFPVDSFTNYNRLSGDNGTNRINKILTPFDLVTTSLDYNEILMFKDDDNKYGFREKAKSPKPIALYCYDTICENDLLTAKNLGIGIVIINTKKYDRKNNQNQIKMSDTTTFGLSNKYDYLKNVDQDSMIGRRK